jgi:hypothetical protein
MTPLMKRFSQWNRDQKLDCEVDIVELLLEFGADLNAVDGMGLQLVENRL